MDFDPYANDPIRWGHSMAHMAELMLPCLDAVGARTVAEIGAYAGDLTRVLLDWAGRSGARVVAIDPSPREQLVELAHRHDCLELIRETSLDALPRIELPDAVVIDGDHNYWTVSEELRLLGERAEGAHLPLLLVHDVCWPHARRDDYFATEQIPDGHRHPVVGQGGGIVPWEKGSEPDGMPYPNSADHEGGPRNGVLTAVEDFVNDTPGLRLVVVPAFFGLGAVWHEDAPWAARVAEILDPWDRHPVLERLEANRVHQIAAGYHRVGEINRLEERVVRQEALLRRLLVSSAFRLAERLSRLRDRAGVARGQTVVSKDEVRRALED